MRRQLRKTAAAVLLALIAALAGCGGRPAGQDASSAGSTGGLGQEESGALSAARKDSVIVVMGPTSEPEAGFDPAYGWGAGEHVHEPLIQSTLTVTNQDLTIGYDLAADVEASEDGLAWTVKIRDGVRFTDGQALTAKDVAFTYNTVKDASSVNDFTMLDHAEALDERTVVFHMNKPYSIWPYTMAMVGIVPEHAYGPEYGQHPIGSGRYVLKQWDKGQQVILEANPDYYGETPKMRQVTVLFMEEDAAYAAVLAGQADLAYTAATYGDQAVDGYQLLSVKTVDNRGINLPALPPGTADQDGVALGNAVTCDPAVRKAVNMGIDRQEMIEHVLNGYGSPAYSVCDGLPWYNPESETSYDREQAKALLEQAGWVAGADQIRVKDGVRAEFSLVYPAGDSVRQALASDTANQLRELGIDVKVQGAGWDTAYDLAQSQPLMWGWGAHTPMELYNIYHTKAGSDLAQYSPYHNAALDRYMDEALACGDLEQSYELWKKAQWDGVTGVTKDGDIPWVWLVNIDHLYWVRDGLEVAQQKIHPHGHGWSIVNNVDRWTWR